MRLPVLNIGMSKTIQKKITEEDTALYFGSGSIKDLLATPVLSALMIEAAVSVVDPLLPDNYITIGKSLSIDHFQPTVKDMTVTVNASISEIENNKIVFQLKAYDELGEIGSGYHERHIVNHSLLREKVSKRIERLKSQP